METTTILRKSGGQSSYVFECGRGSKRSDGILADGHRADVIKRLSLSALAWCRVCASWRRASGLRICRTTLRQSASNTRSASQPSSPKTPQVPSSSTNHGTCATTTWPFWGQGSVCAAARDPPTCRCSHERKRRHDATVALHKIRSHRVAVRCLGSLADVRRDGPTNYSREETSQRPSIESACQGKLTVAPFQ
jgi:hypothetical protein